MATPSPARVEAEKIFLGRHPQYRWVRDIGDMFSVVVFNASDELSREIYEIATSAGDEEGTSRTMSYEKDDNNNITLRIAEETLGHIREQLSGRNRDS